MQDYHLAYEDAVIDSWGNMTDYEWEEFSEQTKGIQFRTIIGLSAMVSAVAGINASKMSKDKTLSVKLLATCGLAFYGSFGVMVCALTPISLSRILAAKASRIYEKKVRIFFVCYVLLTFAAYVVAFVSNTLVFRIVEFTHFTTNTLSHSNDTTIYAFVISARHLGVVQSLRDTSRLMETRQIAIATFAQALVPLVCQVPAFLILSSSLFNIEPITGVHINAITQIWLAASPLFDAIITIAVIKQYRKETSRMFSSLCKYSCAKQKETHTIIYSDEQQCLNISTKV